MNDTIEIAIRRFVEEEYSGYRRVFADVLDDYGYIIRYDDDDWADEICNSQEDLVWSRHDHAYATLWHRLSNDMQYDVLNKLGLKKQSRLSVGKNVKLPLPDAKLLHT